MANDIILKNSNNETVIYSGVSKIKLNTNDGGTKLFIDTSDSTVVEDKLAEGYTAYDANGNFIEGKLKEPSGTIQITTNGTHNVKDFESADVNIPEVIPEGYIKPEGTLEITSNGKHNVSEYKEVDVNITPEKIEPNLQVKTITSNGEHLPDEGYDGISKVIANVPIPEGYVIPSGSINITTNGEYDVAGKKTAIVNVQTSAQVTAEEVVITPSKETQVTLPINADYISKVTTNPIPESYIQPEGIFEITAPGEYNVKSYEKVDVKIEPTGNALPLVEGVKF